MGLKRWFATQLRRTFGFAQLRDVLVSNGEHQAARVIANSDERTKHLMARADEISALLSRYVKTLTDVQQELSGQFTLFQKTAFTFFLQETLFKEASSQPAGRLLQDAKDGILPEQDQPWASPAMLQAVAVKTNHLADRMLALSRGDAVPDLTLRPAQVPLLVAVNGDLLWIPADLLRFISHTRADGGKAIVPYFLAETPHYLWTKHRLRPGHVAFDVGTSIGLFTVMMAQAVAPGGAVHAFEPSPAAHADLLRVLSLNEVQGVTTHRDALSDQSGEATLCIIDEGDVRREATHLKVLNRAEILGNVNLRDTTVQTTTIDEYIQKSNCVPNLIKIDAEGAELKVLEGAVKSMEQFKPLLVIEVHEDAQGRFDHDRLKAYLQNARYTYKREGKIYYCE